MQQTVETALVGSVYREPKQIPTVRMIVPNKDYFDDKRAGMMYDTLCDTYVDVNAIDIPTLNQRLQNAGLSPSDVVECSDFGSPFLGEHYARLVAEGHITREAKRELRSALRRLEDPSEDVIDVVNAAQGTLINLRRIFKKEKSVSITRVAEELRVDLEQLFKGKKIASIPFGFTDIDNVTGGMDPGDLTVIAALEKSGKTTLMTQIVKHNALQGTPCLIFSCEMTRKQILLRMALMDTKILWSDLKQNHVTDEQRALVLKEIAAMAKLPIYIRHGVLNIMEIAEESQRFVRDHGTKLITVDYIQRVVPVTSKTNENREREVAAISSGLKNVALECSVPLIALSQVNEELRARESRAIEQDMDRLILIDRHPDVKSDKSSVSVRMQIRQRMGLSTGMGDLTLCYDLRGGIWRSEVVS